MVSDPGGDDADVFIAHGEGRQAAGQHGGSGAAVSGHARLDAQLGQNVHGSLHHGVIGDENHVRALFQHGLGGGLHFAGIGYGLFDILIAVGGQVFLGVVHGVHGVHFAGGVDEAEGFHVGRNLQAQADDITRGNGVGCAGGVHIGCIQRAHDPGDHRRGHGAEHVGRFGFQADKCLGGRRGDGHDQVVGTVIHVLADGLQVGGVALGALVIDGQVVAFHIAQIVQALDDAVLHVHERAVFDHQHDADLVVLLVFRRRAGYAADHQSQGNQ